MNAKQRQTLGKYLQSLAKKTVLGVAEAGTGGNLVTTPVPPDVEVIKPDFAAGSIWDRCRKFRVGDMANGGKIPLVSQDTYGITGVYGGARAYFVTEGATDTTSSFAFDAVTKTLGKIVAIVPVTREVLADADYLAEYVSDNMSVALRVILDWGVLYGAHTTAESGFSGIMAASGGFTTATQQVATSVSRADLESMVADYYGGPAGVWIFSKRAWNNILANVDQYISIIDFRTKTLYGIPYVINPSNQAAKAVLGDFSQYGAIYKPVQESFDIDLYWQSDQMLFKGTMRAAGRAMWKGPVTLDDASVVYPFVVTQ